MGGMVQIHSHGQRGPTSERGMSSHIDLRAERDRIVQELKDSLSKAIAASYPNNDPDRIPSPRMADSLRLDPVCVPAGDVARIIGLLEETLDHVYLQGQEADANFQHVAGRISAAQREYRNPRVKTSKAKAVAAAKALGLTAKDPTYWDELLKDYERYTPENTAEKQAAITGLAKREGRSCAAILQGLKRAIRKRRDNDIEVQYTPPRSL
jgi:hypothetical protein